MSWSLENQFSYSFSPSDHNVGKNSKDGGKEGHLQGMHNSLSKQLNIDLSFQVEGTNVGQVNPPN
jgi:hypothetical protein